MEMEGVVRLTVVLCCVAWKWDGRSGETIYGYTMDSCADGNFWCQTDTYHLDISQPYLGSLGLLGSNWNGRKISWRYMDGTAPGYVSLEVIFLAHVTVRTHQPARLLLLQVACTDCMLITFWL